MPKQSPDHRLRLAQIALNEAAFRSLNEQIYGPGGSGEGLQQFAIACECGSGSCVVTLTVEATLYGDVRADPHRFLVMLGHEDPEAETVVQRQGELAVVEKHAGEPQRLVEATDPRSTDPT
jgi:hypothetical protein